MNFAEKRRDLAQDILARPDKGHVFKTEDWRLPEGSGALDNTVLGLSDHSYDYTPENCPLEVSQTRPVVHVLAQPQHMIELGITLIAFALTGVEYTVFDLTHRPAKLTSLLLVKTDQEKSWPLTGPVRGYDSFEYMADLETPAKPRLCGGRSQLVGGYPPLETYLTRPFGQWKAPHSGLCIRGACPSLAELGEALISFALAPNYDRRLRLESCIDGAGGIVDGCVELSFWLPESLYFPESRVEDLPDTFHD